MAERTLSLRLTASLADAVASESRRTGETPDQVALRLIGDGLGLHHHGLFQVSTSAALVQGVFDGAITVAELLEHGDFGIGTFDGLDGEMVVLGGRCYRAGAGGVVEQVDGERTVPFAVVTRFAADIDARIDGPVDLAGLHTAVDEVRPSQNAFIGLRIDGAFDRLELRAACPAGPGEGLVEATRHQSEYVVDDVSGTLVGFWTPLHTRSFAIPGYHLHFLSDDRTLGGHVLGLRSSGGVHASLHVESDVHLALPETEAFLRADLRDDPVDALDEAE